MIVKNDVAHSMTEARYYVLGKTNAHRRLFLVFTVRNNKIRVISARDMSKEEREIYAKAEKDVTIQRNFCEHNIWYKIVVIARISHRLYCYIWAKNANMVVFVIYSTYCSNTLNSYKKTKDRIVI